MENHGELEGYVSSRIPLDELTAHTMYMQGAMMTVFRSRLSCMHAYPAVIICGEQRL